MTTWASTDEVMEITGISVSDSELAQAGAVIDIYSNRTTEASGETRTRDRYWLKQAVAWQTIWQSQQPGYTTRHVADEFSQDGVQSIFQRGAGGTREWALALAPLAARSLKNLSWKADRTLRGRNIREPVGFPLDPFRTDWNREALDDQHPWSPL